MLLKNWSIPERVSVGATLSAALITGCLAAIPSVIYVQAAAAGALGGLAHEIAQSGGKIFFIQKRQGGVYLGSLTGIVLGSVSALLVLQGFLPKAQVCPQSNIPAAMKVECQEFTDDHQKAANASLVVKMFLAGLALKGVSQAALGSEATKDENGKDGNSGDNRNNPKSQPAVPNAQTSQQAAPSALKAANAKAGNVKATSRTANHNAVTSNNFVHNGNSQTSQPASPKPLKAIQDYETSLNVSTLKQPNPYTCQSTCIAMALDLKASDIPNIYAALKAKGSPGNPYVMSGLIHERIQGLALNYEFSKSACLDDVKAWLEAGDFLITHGWFTHSGHVICLSGVEIDTKTNSYKFEVKDPWSQFDAPNWNYDLSGSSYDGYYPSDCIYAACVAGASYSDAASVYQRHELDSSKKGMWVHRFTSTSTTQSSQSTATHNSSQSTSNNSAQSTSNNSSGPLTSSTASTSVSTTPSALQQAFSPLFNLITQGEGSPNAMNQGTMGDQIVGSTLDSQSIIGVKLTSLTLAEILKRQAYEMDENNPQQNKYGVFAAGKYQFIPSTLKSLVAASGVATSRLFDVSTQDFLCLELIRTSASATYQYVQGKSNDLDAAINALASQWASLPTTSGGTAYAGTGNSASHSVDSVSQVLREVRAKAVGQS